MIAAPHTPQGLFFTSTFRVGFPRGVWWWRFCEGRRLVLVVPDTKTRIANMSSTTATALPWSIHNMIRVALFLDSETALALALIECHQFPITNTNRDSLHCNRISKLRRSVYSDLRNSSLCTTTALWFIKNIRLAGVLIGR